MVNVYLSNILNSGVAEISNNLSEQRVKPIKFSLKNCLNIGSEEAANRQSYYVWAHRVKICRVYVESTYFANKIYKCF